MRRWVALAAASVLGCAAFAAELKTKDVIIKEVRGVAPASWKEAVPAGQFRLLQWQLPRAAGDPADGTLIVYHFGKNGGGTLEENMKRWVGMMVQPDGKPSKDVAKVSERKAEGVKITSVDLSGTYQDRPFPAAQEITPRPNYRLFAAMIETTAESGEGPYWVRAVGPAKTMAAHKEGWETFIKSLSVPK